MPILAGASPNFSNGFLTYLPVVAGMPNNISIGNLSTSTYNIIAAQCGLGKYIVTNNGTVTADLSGSPGLGSAQFGTDTVVNVGRTTVSAEYFGGQVKEIMYFDRVVTNTERQDIEHYLAKKWNLLSLLPVNHPGFTQRSTLIADGLTPRRTAFNSCLFWFDAATLISCNYFSGQTIPSLTERSIHNAPVDVSGTLRYNTTLYGVPGINTLNGVAIGRMRTGGSLVNYIGTIFVVASLFVLTPGTPQYGVTLAPGATPLSNVNRILFTRSDTSLSVANILGGTGGVLCNLSCNTTSTGMPFIWETAFANASQLFALCNGTFPARSSGHNSTGGFTNTRVFMGCDASAANTPSWRGNIHEVIIFPGIMGDWDRYQIRGYLAQKWRISNSVPFGTPYKLVAP
jgi:hypothetical protein